MNDIEDRLEALIPQGDGYNSEYAHTLAEAVEALREAKLLSAEPVAWMCGDSATACEAVRDDWITHGFEVQPLYAHPPAAEIEDLRRDAEYLLWVSKNWGGQRHDYANHVLRVGGTGDLGDIRTFISAAIAQQEADHE